MTPPPLPGAYSGVRVLDVTEGIAGGVAAMLLADFGAEVIRIEPPGSNNANDAPGYLAFHRGKQILALDIRDPGGSATLTALLAGADVVLFDASPAGIEARGWSAQTLEPAFPNLIHAWLPPYGTKGRWRNLPPRHSLLAALSGYCWRQGAQGDVPIDLVVPYAWYGQGMLATSMIGAALFERSQSGRGQGLTVSGLHAFSQVGGPVRELKRPRTPRADAFGSNPRSRIYRCSDDTFLFVCAFFPSFYRKLFEVLGHSGLIDIFDADDEAARNLLDATFPTRPRHEWMELLKNADIPCAPVQSRDSWLESDVVKQANLRLAFQHPTLGEVTMPGPPAELSDTPMRARHLPEPIVAPPHWSAIAAASPSCERKAPLSGIRVLNLGTVIAGAQPGAILAFLGADVVKVEAPGGDQFRYDPGFLALNRGTRSLGLDISRPDGRSLFLDLVRKADVVIDNYRCGVRERLGIDYVALRAINPRIISCSITAYGDRGDRATVPGFDPLLQAESGIMAAQGGDDDPVAVTMGVNDVGAASMVCSTVIAALNARNRTGQGQEVRTSLLAQSLQSQLGEFVSYPGRPANPKGGCDFTGPRALQRFYPCRDGWLAIACESEAEAAALAKTLNLDMGELAHALLAPGDGALASAVRERLDGFKRDEAFALLLAHGVPAAPVLNMQEVFEDEELRLNCYLERWEHPTRGPLLSPTAFAYFSATPTGFHRPSPDLGEHSRDILSDYAIPDDIIEKLVSSNVVF